MSAWENNIIRIADSWAFSWKVREWLYRHLSVQIGNGVQVGTALETFRSRLQRRKRVSSVKVVNAVIRRMRNGMSLATALSLWIPDDEVTVIDSGELSGNLPKGLDLIIAAKRSISRVRGAFFSALIAPTVYLIAVFLMLWAMGRFIIPDLVQALPRERALGMVHALYVLGDFANSWTAVVPLVILLCFVILVVFSLPRWTGRSRIYAERFFPYSFYRNINGYIWLMSFSAVLQAGMSDVDILRRQVKQASPWLMERLQALLLRMNNGASLAEALLARGKGGLPPFGFPNPDIVDDIASMHGFKNFNEKIGLIARQWAEDLETSTLVMAKRFGFAIEIMMYVVMIFLVVAINSMSAQLGGVSTTF